MVFYFGNISGVICCNVVEWKNSLLLFFDCGCMKYLLLWILKYWVRVFIVIIWFIWDCNLL